VKGRPVRDVSSATGRLNDFLLSEAESHFNVYESKWIVGASFDAFPLTDSLQLQLPALNATNSTRWSPGRFRAADAAGSSRLSTSNTQPKPLVVGHFSVESYHAIAVSLALVNLAKLNYLVPASYHIQTVNHPLPRQPETVVMDEVVFTIIIIIIIVFTS